MLRTSSFEDLLTFCAFVLIFSFLGNSFFCLFVFVSLFFLGGKHFKVRSSFLKELTLLVISVTFCYLYFKTLSLWLKL